MIPTTVVNELTVIHKASDGVAIAAAPDVCLTPSPAGPIPVPYPNIALSVDLANGTTSVFVDGQSVAVKDAEFAISTGDEGGTAGGGVVSGVIKGKAKLSSYSMDVFFEGRNVGRLSDSMTMNGNQSNTATPAETQGNNVREVLGWYVEVLCQAHCFCSTMAVDGTTFQPSPPSQKGLPAATPHPIPGE